MSEVNARAGGFEYRESGGYDRAQVDSFINEVKKYIAGQKNEKQLLTQKLHVLAVKIQEYQALEAENGTLEEKASALRAECKTLENSSAELTEKCRALEAELSSAGEGIEAKKAELSGLEATLESLKSQAFGLDGAIKAKSAELSSIEEKVAVLREEEGRLALLAVEEQNEKTAMTRDRVAEQLAALSAYVNAQLDAIRESVENGPVVSVSVEAAPAAPAAEPAAEPAEPLTVAQLLEEEDAEEAPVAEAEPSEEELRSNRDTARSVLRSVAGFEEEDEDSPTKVMPEDIDKIPAEPASGASVDIVINAEPAEEAEEETGWCAPEESVELSEEPAEEIFLTGPESAEAPEEKTETSTVAVLTPEEAEGLSYDDALALVLKKNGIEYKSSKPETVEPEPEAPAEVPEEKKPEEAPTEKPKKEKKGFFAALKRNIDAILEDDEDDEEEEFTGTEIFTPDSKNSGGDQPTLRFGREQNGKKK